MYFEEYMNKKIFYLRQFLFKVLEVIYTPSSPILGFSEVIPDSDNHGSMTPLFNDIPNQWHTTQGLSSYLTDNPG
jgi:hypothetical protein